MDLRTAVEQGILAPIRCVRVKTDIDLSDVRIHGIKYDAQDLESKLFVPERNELIVNTYMKYARGKKAVVFCTSVNHASEIARLLKEAGVNAEGISGSIKGSGRNSILQWYEHGNKSWCTDFIYIPLSDGSMRYNCTIIDLYDRSVIASVNGMNITYSRSRYTNAFKNNNSAPMGAEKRHNSAQRPGLPIYLEGVHGLLLCS